MTSTYLISRSLAAILLILSVLLCPTPACCPAPPSGKPVVNADQTVIMIWDAATQTQHFIRQASFNSAADDFGFLVPTPSQPELEESGDQAFPFLLKLTEPPRKTMPRPSRGIGCASVSKNAVVDVRVLAEKIVAGFHAVVLQANSVAALVDWLQHHGYAYSSAIEEWAKPYVDNGWAITALKIAKSSDERRSRVTASSLRLTFKTDRPLFPYREPDSASDIQALRANRRLLRIYFLAEARYRGDLTESNRWTGEVAWANKLKPADRHTLLELLQLPESTLPNECWLTEFEDNWPYKPAPADLYFSRDATQDPVERKPIIEYVSARWSNSPALYVAAAFSLMALFLWFRRGRWASPTA